MAFKSPFNSFIVKVVRAAPVGIPLHGEFRQDEKERKKPCDHVDSRKMATVSSFLSSSKGQLKNLAKSSLHE